MKVPWAEPKVTYTRRFEEAAIQKMSQMSLAATARGMSVSWRVLDHIVKHRVRMYLDMMDLCCLRRIRINETSAKKNHRYITIVTDVDTGRIVFICKGKNTDVVGEFREWLLAHNGHSEKITLVSSDFGKNLTPVFGSSCRTPGTPSTPSISSN